MDRKQKWIYLGIGFVVLVAVRVFLWVDYSHTPIPKSPFADPLVYVDLGKNFASGQSMPQEAVFHPPLYPYIVGALFSLFGPSTYAVIIFQNILGILSALLLLALLIGVDGNPRRLAIALVLLFQSGAWIFYEWRIYPEALAVSTEVILLTTLWWLWRDENLPERNIKRHVGLAIAGLVSAVLILLRPNFVLLIPTFATWVLVRSTREKLSKWALPYLVVVPALALVPVMIRNHALGGGYSLSVNTGITFYQGNNSVAQGGYTVVPGISPDILRQNEDVVRIARAQGALTLPDTNRFWLDKGLGWWRENPGDGIRLLLKKALIFLSPGEFGGDMPFDFERMRVPSLRLSSVVNFTFVLFFSFFGMGLLRGSGFPLFPAAALLGISAVTCLVFYVNNRYRVPAWPLLIVPAVFGLDATLNRLRPKGANARNRTFDAYIVLAIGVVILLQTARLSLSPSQLVAGWHNWGVISARTALVDQAIESYRKVLELNPTHLPTLENLSREYLRKGDLNEAERTLNLLLAKYPNSHVGHKAMADLYARRGDVVRAREESQRASELRNSGRPAF